jgi:hypothetical protein
MAPTLAWRFAIDMCAEDGRSLGVFFAQPDWEPVCEWTRFHFQRKGRLSLNGDGSVSVAPLWDSQAGTPFCRGFRVEISEPGKPAVGADFPNSQFKEYAALVASALVTEKRLGEGEDYSYRLVAFPAAPKKPQAGGLQVFNASPALPVRTSVLAEFRDRSHPAGAVDSADMPVFVPPRILEEMAMQTHAHEGTETGGVLIGTLWRDAGGGEIFLEITAQIPGEHTSGDQVKLTFTPQTWAAADAALRLRNRSELFAGYWHSHPVKSWCRTKSCSLEAQKNCRLARDFFSADDVAVMRAAFPSAWCIAIVANDTAFADLTFSMFGNREGITQPRGYYVLEANAS